MRKKEMQSFCSSLRKFGLITLAWFTVLVTCGLPAHGQQSSPTTNTPAVDQHQDPQAGKTNMAEEEVAHPFFTHMGVPEAVGVFNLRLAGLATRADGHTDGDFAFHFETGLTKYIGCFSQTLSGGGRGRANESADGFRVAARKLTGYLTVGGLKSLLC